MTNLLIDWPELYRLGFSLIPVRIGEKIPAIQWRRFQSQRATMDEISEWQWEGQNAGIVTGAISGIIVLDLDSEAALSEAARRGIPQTLTVITARGRHLYFQHPGFPVRNRVKIFPGADLRGDGGLVVVVLLHRSENPADQFFGSQTQLLGGHTIDHSVSQFVINVNHCYRQIIQEAFKKVL